jgi:hypothetical protein
MRQVAEAAHALHEAGIVHRDIKPGNIMVSARGTRVVLMDLGLAQLADEADGKLTRTRQFVGTLRYASPEQILAVDKLDRRSDVYSLGATLWELLTLRPLYGATDETPTAELMKRIQYDDPERVRKYHPGVPADLEAVVLKCLKKRPEQRYATARELAEDLGRWLRGRQVRARREGLALRFWRRHRAVAFVSALLALYIAASVGGLLGLSAGLADVVDYSHAHIWVGRHSIQTVEQGSPIPESQYRDRLLTVPEFADVEPLVLATAHWGGPHGASTCMVVGSRLEDPAIGCVQQLTPEMRRRLAETGAVAVDEADLYRLGVSGVGDVASVGRKPVRIVGIVRGFRASDQPRVFCSLETAKQLCSFDQQEATYLLARCHNVGEAPAVVSRLQHEYPDMSVFTSWDLSFQSRMHWLTSSKFGPFAVIISGLTLIAAIILATRVLYAAMSRQLREIGGRDANPSRVWLQMIFVLLRAVETFVLCVIVSFLSAWAWAWLAWQIGIRVLFPYWMVSIVLVPLTLAMLLAGLVAGYRSLRAHG